MDDILSFAGDYWWLIFIVGPVVGGWIGGVAKYNERRRRDRIELERVRRAPIAPVAATAAQQRAADAEADRADRDRQIDRILADHDEIDRRWLDFELDVAKLIDYPLVTDMREPLTQTFHRAKRVADGLRPAERGELRAAGALERYREAVRDYEVAFEAAVREAKRRAQSGFSDAERSRLESAQRLMALAENEASTPAERQSAYKQARRELDGLIALPDATTHDIERRIAGEIEA
ncbi:hypothetical protein SAMN04487783_1994 [Agrococcus baldri]|uniref:Uncharacterized protein n=1 Tax=Agrococcus baldri TaxID=153730 RepID=A0AA94HNR4_9MICO|nr:hypothetical protein [Agrococcus baldri]SFS15237.1 hypothetical protein SAMN04487783_1994 [Agrococcus baldri]